MERKIIYVAENGSDSADGSKASPFATLERAREEAVKYTSATVEVGRGLYRTSLVLDERDEGCEYRTSEGAVLSGGIRVPLSETLDLPDDIKTRLTPDAADHVRLIDLAAMGYTKKDWGDVYAIGRYQMAFLYEKVKGELTGYNFQVFDNGRRMSLARYPNEGFAKLTGVVDPGEERAYEEIPFARPGIYSIDKDMAARIRKWKSTEGAWYHGYVMFDWADSSSPVTFDLDKLEMHPSYVSKYHAKAGGLFYLYNILEELDVPGEWYLDRNNGKLYVYPMSDDSVFELSMNKTPIFSGKASHVTIDGFNLTCTSADAVKLEGDGNIIRNLCITDIGENAIVLNGYNNLVMGCEISHTGRGGILLRGGERETLTHGNNRAVNNYIHNFSEVYSTYQPGIGLYGVGNYCGNNEISYSPHYAIFYDGNEHLIEYNYVHNIVLHSKDAGAIYSGRDWAAHGTVIRYNILRAIGIGELEPDGIYWDDGLSGQTAYGNILIDVKKYPFLIGGGHDNTVRDNIIIGECLEPIIFDDRFYDGFFRHGSAYNSVATPDSSMFNLLKASPYKSEIWQKKYPSLAEVSLDFNDPTSPHFPVNPANCSIENNIVINKDAHCGKIYEAPMKYSTVRNNHTYHSPDEADFDMNTLKFRKPRKDFPEIPVDKIGLFSGRGDR